MQDCWFGPAALLEVIRPMLGLRGCAYAVGIEPTTFHRHAARKRTGCEAKIIPLDQALPWTLASCHRRRASVATYPFQPDHVIISESGQNFEYINTNLCPSLTREANAAFDFHLSCLPYWGAPDGDVRVSYAGAFPRVTIISVVMIDQLEDREHMYVYEWLRSRNTCKPTVIETGGCQVCSGTIVHHATVTADGTPLLVTERSEVVSACRAMRHFTAQRNATLFPPQPSLRQRHTRA